MRATLDDYFPHLFAQEGGYTANPKDPGNWTRGVVGKGVLKGTKYGIAANTYPGLDIAALTFDDARAIYFRDYWAEAGCDDLAPGLDALAFDIAVNCGVGRWKQWRPIIKGLSPEDAIRAVSERRRRFYRSLPTFKTFGKTWLRRTAEVEAWALAYNRKHGFPDDHMSEPKPKSMATSKIGNAALLAGTSGAVPAVKEAIATVNEVKDTATDAWTLAASAGPWVLLALVVVGAAAFIWWERRRKMVENGE